MWYDAASVVMAIEQCNSLTVSSSHLPSCPKKGNNVHCHSDFPDCEGKAQRCHQSLELANERGDPSILYFDYFDSSDTRKGRIKKKNSTLLLLIKRYGIDERLMVAL